jgi:hypothetical protein
VVDASIGSTLFGLLVVGGVLVLGFLYVTGRILGPGGGNGGGRSRRRRHGSNARDLDPRPTARRTGPRTPAPPSPAPGWYEDPWGVGRRYWNGTNWTADQDASP